MVLFYRVVVASTSLPQTSLFDPPSDLRGSPVLVVPRRRCHMFLFDGEDARSPSSLYSSFLAILQLESPFLEIQDHLKTCTFLYAKELKLFTARIS